MTDTRAGTRNPAGPGRGPARVREATAGDAVEWTRMRALLWPEETPGEHAAEVAGFFQEPPQDEGCFLAEGRGGSVLGFAEVALRLYAEGCSTSPVGYLEGIWVEPEARRTGVARALVRACEAWARARGCTEMGSDRVPENEDSGRFHEGTGFVEVGTIVCYRKEI